MALRLVNTAPGEITDPIKPGQALQMGLKSETLSAQIATTTVDVGFSSFGHTGVLPEDNTQLPKIGVTQTFETSERRRPIDGTVTKALSGGSIVLTKTSNNDGDLGVYELTIPIHAGDSVMAYFKFRKKSAWTPYNPDWCNLTNVVGMYFGVEHGTFNTAAYAFLRNNGTGGSIVLGGPLQAYSTPRPGQTEIAQDLDPVAGGNQGWMGLADNTVIELFIRINTFVSPFRAELWTRIPTTPAPVFQGSVGLAALGQFPNALFTNIRPGPSDTAKIFFGNIGQTGDILQLDDWALFPDYRTAVVGGEATPNHGLVKKPDLPVRYLAQENILPVDVLAGRWFPAAGTPPDPTFFFPPGQRIHPQYMHMSKVGLGSMMYKRTEPRLEERADGFMAEAFMSVISESRIGDLVGPGFVVEDGLNAFRTLALETVAKKMYGIPSSDATSTDSTTYYTPTGEIDFRSPKLVRLTVDRRRSRVLMHIDEEKVVDVPINTPAQLNSATQTVPTSSLNGTTLSIDVSADGGVTYPTTLSHTFVGEIADVTSIVSTLNADGAFTAGALLVVDRGLTFGIRSVATGALVRLRVAAGSTALGTGKLALTALTVASGGASVFPPSSSATGYVYFGHPYNANYTAELRLGAMNYLSRYLAWETEDSLLPDSTALPAATQFTLNQQGVGGSAITETDLTINKSDFSTSPAKRFYRKNQLFTNNGGIQVDFSMFALNYTNDLGQLNAANTPVDLGVVLYLGNKRVHLTCFDCGLGGRRLGIIPGSGTEDDILNQSDLGRRFSFQVDWTVPNNYRIIVRAYIGIEVWSGTTVQDPLLTIPWRNDTDGFDLPLDVSSPGLAFGHFNLLTARSASISKWHYVRWGHSNGYELSVQQKYPNGLKPYLFNGRSFIYSNFDEA